MTDAQQTINHIFGQNENERCLRMFAESICEANQCGANKWGVTLYDDRVRLNVGSIVVCTLHAASIWFALDRDFATSADYGFVKYSGNWQQTGPGYVTVPSIGGYYKPSTAEKHAAVWPRIRRMHFALIHAAANKYRKLRKPCQKSHSKEFMQYLREATNQPDLPSPDYH